MKKENQAPTFTFDDLAEAISRLTPEQRKTQVFAVGEEDSVKINELFVIEEDIYVNKTDPEDRGAIDELKEIHENHFNIADYTLSTVKGTPLLSEDF